MPTKVLCVDDVSAMRQFLKFVLAGIPDVQIDLAEDGVAALKALRRERYRRRRAPPAPRRLHLATRGRLGLTPEQ